jgi:CxxC motif-containing protein (DUF1111 family)
MTKKLYISLVISLSCVAAMAADPEATSDIDPLFDANTHLDPATTEDTPSALITRIADRVRDRHARESAFNAYDHYLSWYWEQRTVAIEIVDHVAKGGSDVTINISSLTPLNKPNFRCFFRGVNTVAEYHHNVVAKNVGKNRYSTTISFNSTERRALELGDYLQFEFSPFLVAPKHGRKNYYGTELLYVVGIGIRPWQGKGEKLDSVPLPARAWLGGGTTLSYQYSDEPQERFSQMATNMAPVSVQSFMLGRRLHHTDFGNGSHSEQPNPVFGKQAAKLGPQFVARSCIACHVNNGRALPPANGAPMYQTVVKVSDGAKRSPHPKLGSALQPQTVDGEPEATVTLTGYTVTEGKFADGTTYVLQRPNYTFHGIAPKQFSVRLAPQLVGLGLLEALMEDTIIGLADPDDANKDGISGRVQTVPDPETGQLRLGRFGYKAGQARLSHQIASALNSDMGVTTAIFEKLDGKSVVEEPELTAADLADMTRYVATLGVSARRGLTDVDALHGEQLFGNARCATCHTPQLITSPYHPLAELRSQTIQPYTDLLLHDMGPGLADNMGELAASGAEWRTSPLWSIGLTAGVSGGEAYLHDGRARNLSEAILWHGGEAEMAKEAFRTMPASDRTALIRFLKSL